MEARLAAVRALVAAGASRAAIVGAARESFAVSPQTVDGDVRRLRAEGAERAVTVELADVAARCANEAEYVGRLAGRIYKLGDLARDLARLGALLQVAATAGVAGGA